MHILITGAAGMIGRKLARRLAADGALGGRAIAVLTLLDNVAPSPPVGFLGTATPFAADLTTPGVAETARRDNPTSFFISPASCRARPRRTSKKAIASTWTARARCWRRSGGMGRRLSAEGRVHLVDRRLRGAVSGHDRRRFPHGPQTCYGTQKVIGELLLADYTRRGMLDGIGIRLPNICIRPGAPNKAASGFFSNIFASRSPGRKQCCRSASMCACGTPARARQSAFSPRGGDRPGALGVRRSLMMPGVSATVGEQIEALRRAAGDAAVG